MKAGLSAGTTRHVPAFGMNSTTVLAIGFKGGKGTLTRLSSAKEGEAQVPHHPLPADNQGGCLKKPQSCWNSIQPCPLVGTHRSGKETPFLVEE